MSLPTIFVEVRRGYSQNNAVRPMVLAPTKEVVTSSPGATPVAAVKGAGRGRPSLPA
jgi:hypothetical protein